MEVLIQKPDAWFINIGPYNGPSFVGPFHDSGEPWQRVNFSKDELNTFIQGPRISSETSVFHQKIDGKIYVIPGVKSAKKISESASGDTYQLSLQWRSGESYFKSSITAPLDLLLKGHHSYASGGLPESRLVHAYHTYLHSPFQVRTNYMYTFEDGAWGKQWAYESTSIIIDSFTRDRVRVRRDYGGNGMTPGSPSKADGLVLVRSTPYKSSRTESNFDSVKYFLDEGSFSMREVRSWMNKLLHPQLFDGIPSLDLQGWDELVHQATGNLDANSANMIAFIKDLRKVKDLIPKLRELGKLSTHADNYLGVQYGVLPTISDLQSIYDAFKVTKYYDRTGYRRVSAYDTTASMRKISGIDVPFQQSRRLHVAVNDRDTGLDALSEKMRSIGVFPSLTNIWDLVPYSFVLDWFVDVGSVLERIDTAHRLSNLDIPYVIKTDKIEGLLSTSDPSIGAGMSITISKYDRQVTTDVPQPRIFGEINKPPTVQDHWIEGTALIIQRRN